MLYKTFPCLFHFFTEWPQHSSCFCFPVVLFNFVSGLDKRKPKALCLPGQDCFTQEEKRYSTWFSHHIQKDSHRFLPLIPNGYSNYLPLGSTFQWHHSSSLHPKNLAKRQHFWAETQDLCSSAAGDKGKTRAVFRPRLEEQKSSGGSEIEIGS